MKPVIKVLFDATIIATQTIEHLVINERLVCVRVTDKRVLASPTQDNEKRFSSALFHKTNEMILTLANLDDFLTGNSYTTEKLRPVNAHYLEDARTKGYMRAAEVHANEFSMDRPTCFERLQAGETLRMVNLDHASHMIFDEHGNVLPTGLYYNYMHGNMRNGAYDLKKVISVLNALPDVYIEDGKNLCIEPVPYSNVSPGCASFLEFVYGPTQEQMTAIWGKAKSMHKVCPSAALHQGAFDLDILGMNAAGATLVSTYYGKDFSSDSNDD